MNNKRTILIILFVLSLFLIFETSNVLAQSSNKDIIWTCLKDKQGRYCQQYSVSICNEECTTSCTPSSPDKIGSCKLGTCIDTAAGSCSPRTPKGLCNGNNLDWNPDPQGNIAFCQMGCCILGQQATLLTQQECINEAKTKGVEPQFRAEVKTSLGCYALSNLQETGACVFVNDNENSCSFITKGECNQRNGQFYSGTLCSSSDIGTICEKEKTTSCVNGKYELYWFDSCGNRENIYEGSTPEQKDSAWNNGKTKIKSESCQLPATSESGFSSQQKVCGNCNYQLGSVCGVKTGTEKLTDSSQSFVCKSLGCTDSSNKKRVDGESWCEYKSMTGTGAGTGGFLRGIDTAGNQHYLVSCQNGEIIRTPCGDYRNNICVQDKTQLPGGATMTNAKCISNGWRDCIELNKLVTATKKADKLQQIADRDDKCSQNPSCYIKQTNVLDQKIKIKTALCAPRYPPGLNYKDYAASADICSEASGIYVLSKNNFYDQLSQLNDLCISLGDCGSKANFIGDMTINHRLQKPKKSAILNYLLPTAYINTLRSFAKRVIEDSITEPKVTQETSPIVPVNQKVTKPKTVSTNKKTSNSGSSGIKPISGNLQFKCLPWQPISGGKNCSQCGNDGLPCTKYGCESLGKGCKIINENTGNAVCIWEDSSDPSPPVITPDDNSLLAEHKYIDASDIGVRLVGSTSANNCLPEYSPVRFAIKTDEPSKCSYDFEKTASKADMSDDFPYPDLFLQEHNFTMNIPTLDELGVSGSDPNRNADLGVYIRCEDANGNANLNEYLIRTCVVPGEDKYPPFVLSLLPADQSTLIYGTTAQNITVYTSEPSDCKWSLEDQSYSDMVNVMECENNIEDQEINGWPCLATLPIHSGSNEFYISCEDQPLLEGTVDEDKRNAMATEVHTYEVTDTPLSITDLSPDNTQIIAGTEPVSISLSLKTSGGIDGTAVCSYKLDPNAAWDDPFAVTELSQTSSDYHSTDFNSALSGNYSINIKCEDSIGNTAYAVSNFSIFLDNQYPKTTRVYAQGNELVVITNEDSVCKYSRNSCAFGKAEGKDFDTSGIIHRVSFDPDLTYYVKCWDSFDNHPDDCNVVVKEGKII